MAVLVPSSMLGSGGTKDTIQKIILLLGRRFLAHLSQKRTQ